MTLQAIAGIRKPEDGWIRFGERTYYDAQKRINVKTRERNVGYLFQNYALFPTMTVAQNIACGVRQTTGRQQRIAQLLQEYRLENLQHHYPSELSGGQQQRVALARIMAYQPEVLLLDEPFSAMDSSLKDQMRLQLRQQLDGYEGTSVLVTHDKEEAYQLCDFLIIMDRGNVVECGETKALFEKPAGVTCARLTGIKNISVIKVLDAHHIRALDWGNIVLTTAQAVPERCHYVGIRSGDLQLLEQDINDNCYAVAVMSVSELPATRQILMQNGLLAELEKTAQTLPPANAETFVYLPKEALHLL